MIDSVEYLFKKLVYTGYCDTMTVGESENRYLLSPQNKPVEEQMILISESSVTVSPE